MQHLSQRDSDGRHIWRFFTLTSELLRTWKMSFASNLVKFALFAYFVVMLAGFVASRVTIYWKGERDYLDEKIHARFYCDKCMSDNFLEQAGDYALGCFSACDAAHSQATPREMGLKALADKTYFCLFWPCQTLGTLKAFALWATLLYGLRYFLSVANEKDGHGYSVFWSPCKLLVGVIVMALRWVTGAIVWIFGRLDRADSVPVYRTKAD